MGGLLSSLLLAAWSIFIPGKKNEVIAALDTQLGHLQVEKSLLLQEKEDLLLQVNSQSDPAWIQLTLKKGTRARPRRA